MSIPDPQFLLEERKVKVEEDKLQIERDKLDFEKSWRKVLGSGLLAGVVALAVAGAGYWQTRMQEINRNAEAAVAQKQQDGLWGIKALELYVTHPREFDPVASPDTAQSNMSALVVAAPEVMKPILLKRQDALVRTGRDSISQLGSAVGLQLGAIQGALAQSPGPRPTSVPGLPPGVDPASYSIYIQYGAGAAEFAAQLGQTLSKDKFRVPDSEAVPQAPALPEVRYYRPDQLPLAEWLAKRVDEQSPGRAAAVAKSIGSSNSPDGIIEVWIPEGWS